MVGVAKMLPLQASDVWDISRGELRVKGREGQTHIAHTLQLVWGAVLWFFGQSVWLRLHDQKGTRIVFVSKKEVENFLGASAHPGQIGRHFAEAIHNLVQRAHAHHPTHSSRPTLRHPATTAPALSPLGLARVRPGERLDQVLLHLRRTSPHKERLLRQGLERFRSEVGELSSFQTLRHDRPDQFHLDETSAPSYFQDVVHSDPYRPLRLTCTDAFFDYEPTPGHEDYWVDFANCSLGGGCFTHGFVQEEIMVHEMPDLAEHIASCQSRTATGWCDISTREGPMASRNRVLQGSPNPYLMKGLHRVQKIVGTYGHVDETTQAVPLPSSQAVNVLAIAAPKLHSKNPREQWDHRTLMDLFNTLVSGFSLVQRKATGPMMIHSGKLGCGAFNNNVHAVYLLHCLAAQYLGCEVRLHGYTSEEAQRYQRSWESIRPTLEGRRVEECLRLISERGMG